MTENQQKLIRYFEALKGMELDAYAMYQKALPGISASIDRDILSGIISDEQRHAGIAQQIIDLLKSK